MLPSPVPAGDHVSPPSTLAYTPAPCPFVPAYTVVGADGAVATARTSVCGKLVGAKRRRFPTDIADAGRRQSGITGAVGGLHTAESPQVVLAVVTGPSPGPDVPFN